jgi:hypothetical protein
MPEKEEQEKNTRKREGSRVFTIYRQFDQGQKASTKSIKQLAAGCWLLAACFVVWVAEPAGKTGSLSLDLGLNSEASDYDEQTNRLLPLVQG